MMAYLAGWVQLSCLFLLIAVEGQAEPQDCSCTFVGDPPVCCDGVDYGCEEQAICNGATDCQLNSCDDGCFCPQFVDPVCCDEGEFSNSCIAGCELAKNCAKCPVIECSGDPVPCLVNPCQFATCPAKPKATCVASQCEGGSYNGTPVGVCEAIFVNPVSGSIVDCELPPTDLDKSLQGDWKLLRIQTPTGLRRFPKAEATLSFTNSGPGSQGNLGGNNGCNSYGADYIVKEAGKIEVGPAFSTLKLCAGPAGKLEGLFMPLIQEVDTFKVGGGRLELFKDGIKVLVFEKE